ncbi:MAG TPA: SH3 domain-containing protein [Bacillota bacterium]
MAGLRDVAAQFQQQERSLLDAYERILRAASTPTERQLAEQILRAQEFQLSTLELLEKNLVPEKFHSFGVINNVDVNVRSGPSARHERVRVLQPDVRVIVMEFSGNWAHIQLSDGTRGWIFKDYVRTDR